VTDREVRDRIDAEIEWTWERFGSSPSWRRDEIGRSVGRILLTEHDVECLLAVYEGYWRPGIFTQDSWQRGERPDPREIEFIDYGGHHRQRWWLWRDLVAPTRRVRALARPDRRARRHCAICGKRAERPYGWHCQFTGDQELRRIVMRKHFTIPGWETADLESEHDWRDEFFWLEKYAKAYTRWERGEPNDAVSPGGICSAECEAVRFSRWYGHVLWNQQQQRKLRGKERQEWEWIKQGKKALKQVQVYLSQRA